MAMCCKSNISLFDFCCFSSASYDCRPYTPFKLLSFFSITYYLNWLLWLVVWFIRTYVTPIVRAEIVVGQCKRVTLQLWIAFIVLAFISFAGIRKLYQIKLTWVTTRYTWDTSDKEIFSRCTETHVESSTVRRNTLRWYGHILRKDDKGDWVRKCLAYEVESAQPRGRPKKTCKEVAGR